MGERRAHLPKLGHARYVDELGLELLEATLRFLPLGEIADESGEDAFSFDARFADCELDRKIRSVLAPASDHAPDADDPLLACPQVALEIPVVLIAIRNRHQDADIPTDELGLAVAKEPLGRRIEGSDAATLVDNDEGVGRRIDDRAQARLARSQLALGALQLRDVAGDLRCPDDPSARIADRRNGDEDIDLRAVLATPHRLVMIDALSARDLGNDLVLFAHPVGRKEDGERTTEHLLGGVAEDCFRRPVPARHGAVQGLADDGVAGRLDDGREEESRLHEIKHCRVRLRR